MGDASDDRFYSALLDDDVEELYEQAPCAYLSAWPDGTLAKVNRTFEAWTGHRRDELVGRRRFQDLLGRGDQIFFETHIGPLLRMQGKVREIAVELVGRHGDRLPVLVNAVLVRDDAGEPSVMRAAIFDATERRAYERELLLARRQAEEAEARARTLAETLQRSFLPAALPSIPGVEVGGAYRPAGDGSEVGGDFYDVFRMGPTRWGLVLGDVCGKGAGAAVLTALARNTARAAAMHDGTPSSVLAEVHDVFLQFHPEQFCTAVFGLVETDAPVSPGVAARLTVASGGHPMPLCRRADGAWDSLGLPGTLVGLVEQPEHVDVALDLRPGDLVVVFTDGVPEARAGAEFFDDERIRAVVDTVAKEPAGAIADALVGAALDFQSGIARDDLAVLVLKA